MGGDQNSVALLPSALSEVAGVEVHSFCWRSCSVYVGLGNPSSAWIASAKSCLDASELERAEKYYRLEHRERMVWRWWFVRQLLAAFAQCQPVQLQFSKNAWGKPALENWHELGLAAEVPFNLSHTSGAVAVVVGTAAVAAAQDVGVDIELRKSITDFDGMARAIMHESELRRWAQLGEDQRQAWFFDLWSAKEAVLKSAGFGLSVPPGTIAVDPDSHAGKSTLVSLDDPAGGHWGAQVAVFRQFSAFSLAVAEAFPG